MQFSVFLFILWAGLVVGSSDIDALIEFKKGIEKDPLGRILDSWNHADLQELNGCPANWFGIQCGTNNRVSSIALNDMGLVGTINFSALAKLEVLHNFSVSNNHFTGSLSPEVGSFSSLRFLDLSRNSFDGFIPSSADQDWKFGLFEFVFE